MPETAAVDSKEAREDEKGETIVAENEVDKANRNGNAALISVEGANRKVSSKPLQGVFIS
jgi:hypothetical protein